MLDKNGIETNHETQADDVVSGSYKFKKPADYHYFYNSLHERDLKNLILFYCPIAMTIQFKSPADLQNQPVLFKVELYKDTEKQIPLLLMSKPFSGGKCILVGIGKDGNLDQETLEEVFAAWGKVKSQYAIVKSPAVNSTKGDSYLSEFYFWKTGFKTQQEHNLKTPFLGKK